MRDYLEELLAQIQEDEERDAVQELLEAAWHPYGGKNALWTGQERGPRWEEDGQAAAQRRGGRGPSGGGEPEGQGRERAGAEEKVREKKPRRDKAQDLSRPVMKGPWMEKKAWESRTRRDGMREVPAPVGESAREGQKAREEKRNWTGSGENGGTAAFWERMGPGERKTRRKAAQVQTGPERSGETGRSLRPAGTEGIRQENGTDAPPTGEAEAGGMRGAECSGQLKEQLDQARRTAGYRTVPGAASAEKRESRVFSPDNTVLAAGIQARQVDRAFERDARRYDCGFTLF